MELGSLSPVLTVTSLFNSIKSGGGWGFKWGDCDGVWRGVSVGEMIKPGPPLMWELAGFKLGELGRDFLVGGTNSRLRELELGLWGR